MSASDRGNCLFRLADLLEKNKEEMCRIDCIDNGKPYAHCMGFDLAQAIKTYRYYGGWCDKITGKTITIPGPYFSYTRREPVGVCG